MKIQVVILGLALALSACTSTQQSGTVESETATPRASAAVDNFEVTGTLEGKAEGWVYFQKYEGKYVDIDSMELAKGAFSFSGNVETPQRYYVKVPGQDKKIAFFLEPGKIAITADVEKLEDATVTGSALHDEFVAYGKEMARFKEKYKVIQEDYDVASKSEDEDAIKAVRDRAEVIREEEAAANLAYVKNHANSSVGAYIAYRNFAFSGELDKIKKVSDMLSPSLASNPYAITLKERVTLLERVAIGKPALGFTQNDTEGKPFSLSSLKGKYVLIDFWASWCGPCRMENPNVVELYKNYKDLDFEIVGVSLDKNKDKWLEAIEADHLTWYHVSDLKGWQNEVSRSYGVNSIPHTVLLDKEGTIIAKNLRGDELEEKLKSLMN